MKNKILLFILIVFSLLMLCGCGNTESTSDGSNGKETTEEETLEAVDKKLSVQKVSWSEQGSSDEDPVIYTPLNKGDVVIFIKLV